VTSPLPVIAGGPAQLEVQVTLFPTLFMSEFTHQRSPFAEPGGSCVSFAAHTFSVCAGIFIGRPSISI
jgi:hypothetical protein